MCYKGLLNNEYGVSNMSYVSYTLAVRRDADGNKERRVPATGEDLGDALEKAARDRLALYEAHELNYTHLIPTLQLLSLAADAFEDAALVSIGHSRTERYLEHARKLRREVEKLDAKVAAESDAYQAYLTEKLGF